MQNINYGNGIINIPEVGGKMLWKRRNLLLKKDQLKYCYEAILYYAQDILAKRKYYAQDNMLAKRNYCKLGNFRENIIFAKSIERHICEVKKSLLWHDLPISVNDRVIFTISGGFYFHETSHLRSFTKIKPS